MLIEAVIVNEGQKMMSKPEKPITSRVILVKCSNEDGNAPKFS